MNKEQKLIEKKKIIINALKRLLERRVYSQISIEDVSVEAGFSKGGLRHYFPTKEELFFELIEDFFKQIEVDSVGITKGLDPDDRAFISTLFGIERFLLHKQNIRLFINIILYGFEDEKIMDRIRSFLRTHLNMCGDILKSGNGAEDDKDILKGRLVQIILLCAGLFETIDPVDIEPRELISLILKMAKPENVV